MKEKKGDNNNSRNQNLGTEYQRRRRPNFSCARKWFAHVRLFACVIARGCIDRMSLKWKLRVSVSMLAWSGTAYEKKITWALYLTQLFPNPRSFVFATALDTPRWSQWPDRARRLFAVKSEKGNQNSDSAGIFARRTWRNDRDCRVTQRCEFGIGPLFSSLFHFFFASRGFFALEERTCVHNSTLEGWIWNLRREDTLEAIWSMAAWMEGWTGWRGTRYYWEGKWALTAWLNQTLYH